MPPTFLCIRCIQFPFQDLFQTTSYDQSTVGIVTRGHSGSLFRGVRCFASFGEIWEQDDCVFCALLKNTLRSFYSLEITQELVRNGDDAGLYLYRTPLDVTLDRFANVQGNIPLSLSVIISRRYPRSQSTLSLRQGLPTSDLTFAPELIALRTDASSEVPQLPRFGREVEVDKIDWSTVQGWISSCLDHTAGDANNRENASELHLRAVDVIDGCVVSLPPGAQYVALSYVWGKNQSVTLRTDNFDEISSKGYLQSASGRPSKTIVDAAHVVRLLGYQYLWVDALCIIQDDATNIQQNVMEMGSVYSRALFTIVAAAGMNASHGLPGVSPEVPRTQKQHRVTINGCRIANRLQGDVNSTWWNTRGWTYQERVLPMKLLFFTEAQVEYRCETGCSFQEQFHDAYDQASFLLFDSISHLDFTDTNIFTVYTKAVTEYTRRSITNPMDKLRAFQGILGLLKAPFRAPFLFGLPESLFDIGLLWYPAGSLTRGNQHFPSWSWAGWVGSVQWGVDVDEELINLCESTVSICTIYYGESSVRLCDDTLPDTNQPLESGWERHVNDETDEIYYTSQAQPLRGYRYPRPLNSPFPSTYREFIDTKSTTLKIRGRIATLRLTGQHSADIKAECKQGIHEKCNLAVLDDKNRVAGTVIVDGRLIPQLQGRTHQFLALSRSTYIRAGLDEETETEYIEPTWDRENKCFRLWTEQCSDSQQRKDGGRRFEKYGRPLENWIAKPCSNLDPSVRSLPIPIDPERVRGSQKYFSRGETDLERNIDVFDKAEFNDRTPWPRVNVLLLSQETEGCVERIGRGEIHIDAFLPVAQLSTILLK